MIYEITYIEKEKGKKQKLAHPVKDRKALLKLRDVKKNLNLLAKARQGDEKSKAKLLHQILAMKNVIGLVMLERSAGGGYHAVCKRVPGTTILENQVRVSCLLKIEMDTGAHDLQRVVYSTSGSEEDLIYLDDVLFEEPMTPEECEKE